MSSSSEDQNRSYLENLVDVAFNMQLESAPFRFDWGKERDLMVAELDRGGLQGLVDIAYAPPAMEGMDDGNLRWWVSVVLELAMRWAHQHPREGFEIVGPLLLDPKIREPLFSTLDISNYEDEPPTISLMPEEALPWVEAAIHAAPLSEDEVLSLAFTLSRSKHEPARRLRQELADEVRSYDAKLADRIEGKTNADR